MDGMCILCQENELRRELIGTFKGEFILLFKCGVRKNEVLAIELLFFADTHVHWIVFELIIKMYDYLI